MVELGAIPIKILKDEEFKKSLLTYDAWRKVSAASPYFREQFNLNLKIVGGGTWDSGGTIGLTDFPYHELVRMISDFSKEECLEKLIKAAQELDWNINLSGKEREKVIEKLGERSKEDQFQYLLGYFIAKLRNFLTENLERQQEEGVITLGFTPKLCFLTEGKTLTGSSAMNGNCAVIGISPDPIHTILHELGHIFGAEHTEGGVMEAEFKESVYEFTEENKRRIVDGISRKFKFGKTGGA